MGLRKEANPTQANQRQSPSIQKKTNNSPAEAGKNAKTLLRIKYDAGFPNSLYIRGKGGELSWEKGIPLKNVKADEWVWETTNLSNECEYKIVLNDKVFEVGDNHRLRAGANAQITPRF